MIGRRRRTVAVLAGVTGVALIAVSAYTKHATLDKASGWLTFIGAALGVVSVALAVYSILPSSKLPRAVSIQDEASKFLAAVQSEIDCEYGRSRGSGSASLSVRWRQCAPPLIDQTANVYGTLSAHHIQRIQRTVSIEKRFSQLPFRRIIILGKGGSGKSVLAMKLALEMMDETTSNIRVPVLFRMRNWNAEKFALRDWLIIELMQTYKQLRALCPGGATLAEELVDRELIIPILDGFDELGNDRYPQAIERLNQASRTPFILTSREDEFNSAVREHGTVALADGICIRDLSIDALNDYLALALPVSDSNSATWDGFIRRLRDSDADDPLRAALTTPLNAYLLVEAYRQLPTPGPSTLFDRSQYPNLSAIESHLFLSYIDGTFHGTASEYTPAQVRRWLGRVARWLEYREKQTFGWWEIRDTVTRAERYFALSFAGCLGGAAILWPLSGWFGAGIGAGIGLGVSVNDDGPAPSIFGLKVPAARKLLLNVGSGTAGTLLAVAASVPFVPASGLVARHSLQDVFTGSVWPLCAGVAIGVVLGVVDSLAKRLAMRPVVPKGLSRHLNHVVAIFVWGFVTAMLGAVAFGRVAGVVFGIVAGCGAGVVASFEALPDLDHVPTAESSLQTDRAVTIAKFFGFGSLVGVTVAALSASAGWRAATVFGLAAGVANGSGVGFGMNAWGHWLLLSRFWSALTLRMPWRIRAFLHEAHERGVLRQLGGVYQFRHVKLQEALATQQ